MATIITKTPITMKGRGTLDAASKLSAADSNVNPLKIATEINQGAIMVAIEFNAWVKFKRLEAVLAGPMAVT